MERVVEYTIPSGTKFKNSFGTILSGTCRFAMGGYSAKEILTQAKEFKKEGAINIRFLKAINCKHCHGNGYIEVEDVKLTKEVF